MQLNYSIRRDYAIALLAVLMALVVRAIVDPFLGDHLPYYLCYFAVIVAAGFGGIGPGLIALVIGFLSASYFFAAPRFSFGIGTDEDTIGAFRYLTLGAAIVFAGGWARSLITGWKLEVNERRRREAIAQEELDRKHRTLASIGDGLITTDAAGRVTFMNEVAERLSGWTMQHAKGTSIEEVFRIVNVHTREVVPNPALLAVQQGAVMTLPEHTSLVDRHGTERMVADSASPIRDRADNIIGAVLVFREAAMEQGVFTVRSILLQPVDDAQLAVSADDCAALESSCRTWLYREWQPNRTAMRFVSLNGYELIVREDGSEQLPTGALSIRFHIAYAK